LDPPAEADDDVRETLDEEPEAEPEAEHRDEPVETPAVAVKPVLDVLPGLKPWQDVCAGVVFGGAIGDAMGHPTEFIGSVSSIRSKYGPEGVTKFELYWDRGGKHFAPYTDDTQMAEAVLRALLEARGEDLDATMDLMAEKFVHWSKEPQGGHRAPGNACMAGCRALASGTHWSQAGGAQAGGCG